MRGRRSPAPGALELLEEAFGLLRALPPHLFLRYYLGSVPFVLALLYFWADMSHSAFAERRIVALSLVLALLYGWMKVWQADFGARLRSRLTGSPPPPFGGAPLGRVLVAQVGIQPLAFLVLPLAALAALPLAWACAFFHSLSITSDQKAARHQCGLWPLQNHKLLAALWLFGLFVFLNVATGMAALPGLFKSFFGIESEATRSPGTLLNSTFFAVAGGLTYLAIGPVIKAAYAVRCFHGAALSNGEDIEARLRTFDRGGEGSSAGRSPLRASLAMLAVLLLLPMPGEAQNPQATSTEVGGVSPVELEASIERVLSRPEFSWRLTRLRSDPEASWLARSIRQWSRSLGRFFEGTATLIARFLRWLEELLASSEGDRRSGLAPGSLATPRNLLLLGVVVLALVGVLLWRRRRRRPQPVVAVPAAGAARLDLEADDAVAASLPADEWLEHARELVAAGELRLATRAFYLATLSRLAGLELVILARFKSNLDYRRELELRARRRPELVPVFADSSQLFERVWYGRHEATDEMVAQLSSNLEDLEVGDAA